MRGRGQRNLTVVKLTGPIEGVRRCAYGLQKKLLERPVELRQHSQGPWRADLL